MNPDPARREILPISSTGNLDDIGHVTDESLMATAPATPILEEV